MRILYTHRAINDLEHLHDFIAQENPTSASEVSKQILQAIKRLIDFPLFGRKVENSGIDSIRELITGKYVIRYIILNEEIHILRVWHSKEDKLLINLLSVP
jgi:addiction module RelE/StbE family toxin